MWRSMSVEVRIRMSKRLYDLLVRRAQEQEMSLEDLIILTLSRIVRGEARGKPR